MHTMRRDGDGTWTVGFVENDSMNGSCYVVIFKGMGFDSALRLCSVLNGGPGRDFGDLSTGEVESWGMCGHG